MPTAASAFWMPFTANRQFHGAPRMLVAADGMYYRSADGRRVLDGTAGLWCVNAGHARPEITAAVHQQLATLDFAPTFQMGHPLAVELAERLARIAPPGLERVFFANSGSEAVDTALKIALAYHQRRGQSERTVLIGRERAYHGVGFGGMSVGGIPKNREIWRRSLLPGTDHLRHTHDLGRNAFTRGQPAHGAEFADDLERLIAKHGAERIAAVIVEPVAGSTGVLVPPQGYLEKLRAICDRHGVLLILDEVITGFGRLGAPFAAHRFNVRPDILNCAKAINNAAVPMGAVIARNEIHDTIVNTAPEGQIEFLHGYTYSGHPLACAAAVATQKLFAEEKLFERARTMEPHFEAALHSLRGARHVIDIRNIGMVGGIELEPRAGAPGRRALEAHIKCFEAGVMVRFTGDIIALSPPLVIERPQIERIVETIGAVLKTLE
jgi:beta-alanine--pyruvate transaminase